MSAMDRKELKKEMFSFFQRESPEIVKLESCLMKALGELRDKELSSFEISQDFDLRLKNQLQNTYIDRETLWDRFSKNLVYNKGLNYSLSAALACFLVFVSVNKITETIQESPADSAGVVSMDQAQFVDRPSSATFADMDGAALELQTLSNIPNSREVLQSLQKYYSAKGDVYFSTELQKVMKETSLKY